LGLYYPVWLGGDIKECRGREKYIIEIVKAGNGSEIFRDGRKGLPID